MNSFSDLGRRAPSFARRAMASGIFLFSAVLAGGAQAQNNDAVEILKKMSAYIGGQQASQPTYDTDSEVITDDLQKIQFASSGQATLSRPDRLRVSRTGGYADVELI